MDAGWGISGPFAIYLFMKQRSGYSVWHRKTCIRVACIRVVDYTLVRTKEGGEWWAQLADTENLVRMGKGLILSYNRKWWTPNSFTESKGDSLVWTKEGLGKSGSSNPANAKAVISNGTFGARRSHFKSWLRSCVTLGFHLYILPTKCEYYLWLLVLFQGWNKRTWLKCFAYSRYSMCAGSLLHPIHHVLQLVRKVLMGGHQILTQT